LRLCCWITTSVVLFSVRCVLEIWCGWFWVVFVLQAEAYPQSGRCIIFVGTLCFSCFACSKFWEALITGCKRLRHVCGRRKSSGGIIHNSASFESVRKSVSSKMAHSKPHKHRFDPTAPSFYFLERTVGQNGKLHLSRHSVRC